MLPHVSALIAGHLQQVRKIFSMCSSCVMQQVGVEFYVCNTGARKMYIIYHIASCHNPENHNVNNHCSENLKFDNLIHPTQQSIFKIF
jgi:hypothetical protein